MSGIGDAEITVAPGSGRARTATDAAGNTTARFTGPYRRVGLKRKKSRPETDVFLHVPAGAYGLRRKAAKDGALCRLCGSRMTVSGEHRASADHILPKERGGSFRMFPDRPRAEAPQDRGYVRNHRIMCQRCNGLLAACGHCVAALASVRAVAAHAPQDARLALRWFRKERAETPDQTKRRQLNMERVAVARAIDRIGTDEFVFLAAGAAARVWNLATLARKAPDLAGKVRV